MKITIIGAGNVGATCAMRLLEADIADIVLLDIAESLAKGKAEDLMDAASLMKHNKTIVGTADYQQTENSDIIVITAGFARQPGMSREELLNKNTSIVKTVTRNAIKFNKQTIIIVVTNPLDVMTYIAYKESSLDKTRVLGMAGVLDSSRMNLMISRAARKPIKNADALVLGTHGETMVPVISRSTIGAVPLEEAIDCAITQDIIKKTMARGAEIVSYLGKGSAFYAPSAGVYRMVRAIAQDTNEILPCTCMLSGEYGIDNIFLGVPARINRGGIKEIIELPLSDTEKELLLKAAESVRNQINSLT